MKLRKILQLISFEYRYILVSTKVLAIFLMFVMALSYTLQAFVVSAIKTYASHIDKQSQLTVIELNSLRPDSKPIDENGLQQVSHMDHIINVSPWVQHDLDISNPDDWPDATINPGSIWATTYFPARLPKLVAGKAPANLAVNEIILPEKVAGGALSPLLGKTITFGYTHINGKNQGSYLTLNLKVVGIYDNSVPDMDGDNPSYVSMETMKTLFGTDFPQTYTYAHIQIDSAQHSSSVQKRLADMGFSVSGAANSPREVAGLLGTLMHLDNFVLPATLVISLFLGLFLGLMWVKQRKQQLALLRCIGWSSIQTSLLTLLEIVYLTLSSSILGFLIGMLFTYLIARFLGANNVNYTYLIEVTVWNPLLGLEIFGVILMGSACGAIPALFRIARTSPDELLRDSIG